MQLTNILYKNSHECIDEQRLLRHSMNTFSPSLFKKYLKSLFKKYCPEVGLSAFRKYTKAITFLNDFFFFVVL